MREVLLVIPENLERYVEYIPDNLLPEVLLNLIHKNANSVVEDSTVSTTLFDINMLSGLLKNPNVPGIGDMQDFTQIVEKPKETVHIQLKDEITDDVESDMGDLLDLLK